MSLNEDDPIERPPKSSMRPYLIAVLMLVVTCGTILAFIPEFREVLERSSFLRPLPAPRMISIYAAE